MKRLSIYLIVFPFLGFTGPCMGPSPPSSNHNETNDGTPMAPPEQIGPEPADPIEPVPPAPLPPAPPPPSPLPPPPTPELEPVITEPPLSTLTCDQFPSLPLATLPSEEITRTLTSNEATHFWQSLTCLGSPINDLGEISDCERLLAGTYTNAYDKYSSVFKFLLTDLPTADEVENVTLNLYPLQGSVFFVVTLGFDIRPLTADWWRECFDEEETWRPLCDYEMPITGIDETIDWQLGEDERGYYLLSLEFTELYRDWQTGTQPNHGLMIHSIAGLFNFFIFAGPDFYDPAYRPRLDFTAKEKETTLFFPLAGGYSGNRVSGYVFGDWWQEQRCVSENDRLGQRLRHTGVDYAAEPDDRVYAVYDGIVKYAATDSGWGGYVVLEHGGQWTSSYTHVLPTVSVGNSVERGGQIATISYGNVNFDPHLHFQVLDDPYDPLMGRRGRLPDGQSCTVAESPYPQPEPAFPLDFVDPKCLDWE